MNIKHSAMNALVALACLCGIVPAHAEANNPPGYAVLSLIGDKLSLVAYRGSTASRLPPTRKGALANSTPLFDDEAIIGAGEAIKQFQPDAAEVTLATKDAALYKLQGKIFGAGDDAAAARETIRAMLKNAPVSYVIVLTKYQDDIHLTLPDQENHHYYSDGHLEGVGFYVNEKQPVKAETGESRTGFVSSFVYVKATVLDAKTLRVISDHVATNSESSLNMDSDIHAAGVVSSSTDKMESLLKLVRYSVHDVVLKALLASAGS